MSIRLTVGLALAALLAGAAPARAQDPGAPAPPPPVDSIAVEGNSRVTTQQVIAASGLVPRQPPTYRDIQRAITMLFRTGQFDDVRIEQRYVGGRIILAVVVTERPVLANWSVRGVSRLSVGDVRERVKVLEGRPIDRTAVERSRAGIDSLYRREGFYAASVETVQVPDSAGNGVRIIFDVHEGSRVALSQVVIDGNEKFDDAEIVGNMSSRPEGFWWFRKGEYDERKVDQDVRERLPR